MAVNSESNDTERKQKNPKCRIDRATALSFFLVISRCRYIVYIVCVLQSIKQAMQLRNCTVNSEQSKRICIVLLPYRMPYDFFFRFFHSIQEPDLLDVRISVVHCSLKASIRFRSRCFWYWNWHRRRYGSYLLKCFFTVIEINLLFKLIWDFRVYRFFFRRYAVDGEKWTRSEIEILIFISTMADQTNV